MAAVFVIIWSSCNNRASSHRRQRHTHRKNNIESSIEWSRIDVICCVYAMVYVLFFRISFLFVIAISHFNCMKGNLLMPLLLLVWLVVLAWDAAVAIFISLLSHHIFIVFVFFHMLLVLYCLRDFFIDWCCVVLSWIYVCLHRIQHDLKCETV